MRAVTCFIVLFIASAAYSPAARSDGFSFPEDTIVVVEPGPGRVTVGPVKPSWCHATKPWEGAVKADRVIVRAFGTCQRYGFTPGHVEAIFSAICAHPDHPSIQKQAGYVIQAWVNETGQTKDEAIKSMTLRANSDKWKAALEDGCSRFRAPEEPSHEQLEMAHARRTLFCNGEFEFWHVRGKISRDWKSSDYKWHVDRRADPPSEIDRVTATLECLPPRKETWTRDTWMRIGLCGHDARALDRAKLETEIAKMAPELQAVARESYSTAKILYADLERGAKEKVDSDPDYKQILYEVPRAAWKAWVAEYSKHKKAVEATYAFEKDLWAPRRSAVKGCWEKVNQGVLDFVKASKFKTKEQFIEGVQGPIGYVLLNALGSCYAVDAPWRVGKIFLDLNKKTRVWRGPRAAARWAMMDALAQIKTDRTQFPLDIEYLQDDMGIANLVRKRATSPEMTKISNASGDGFDEQVPGVVKRLAKVEGKDHLRQIEFKAESWMEETGVCTETNKVQRVEPDGRVVYRTNCRSTGKKKKTYTPNPTQVYKWDAVGIKPNAFVIVQVPTAAVHAKMLTGGYPVAVYKTKQQKQLVAMYGFPL